MEKNLKHPKLKDQSKWFQMKPTNKAKKKVNRRQMEKSMLNKNSKLAK